MSKREVYRVLFNDLDRADGVTDCPTFKAAKRLIRQKYPDVEFKQTWSEWPPAINGDRCCEVSFGTPELGTLGQVAHLQLMGNK